MSVLWTSSEAQSATLGHATRPFTVSGFSIDTRTLKAGDLYVAIKGGRDGHDFVAAALEAGAGAAMVSKRPENVADDAPLLIVASTQRALEDLGSAARSRTHAEIVAVTGSAGKTTTKEMLKLALGTLGLAHASSASFNNHLGVPLSLASLPREAAYGVFELGMNHFGEIRSLVSLVRPQVALITTIAPAHLEFFGTVDAIADAKSEIFAGLQPGGAALLPADSEQFERLAARAGQAGVSRVLSFGAKEKSDARLTATDEAGEGVRVKADILGQPVTFHLGAQGHHNAVNAVAALLCVAALGGDVQNAAAGLKDFSALKGRGARINMGGVTVIDESYNANPASMAAALSNLGKAKGRRVAVLGDMLEMGPEAFALHAGLAPAIEAANVDLVFLCGEHMKALWEKLPEVRRGAFAPASGELAMEVAAAAGAGDTILVKGSNAGRMSIIVEALKARTA